MEWNDFPAVSASHLNTRHFLDFLGRAEGADYNTIVGGGKFDSYDAHPNIVGLRTAEGPSTAAGRYQITGTTYRDVAPKLGITDFSPESQDRIALELIKRKGAMQDIENGDFNAAIAKLGGTWASLPSSPYSQPKRSQSWVEQTLNSIIPAAHAGETKGMAKQSTGWDAFPAAAKPAAQSSGGWDAFPAADAPKGNTDAIPVPPVTPVESAPLPDITPPANQAAPQVQPQAQPAPAQAAPAQPSQKLTDAGMNTDPTWINNAKTIYKDVEGKDFVGNDADAADWLKNYVAQTKWNLAGAGTTIRDAMSRMTPESKKALLDSIKAYDDADVSWESVGRGLKGVATDPTTYITGGIGNLFTKTIGKKAAQEGLKQALEAGLKKSLGEKALQTVTGQTAKAAATGATYGAAGNLAEQGVQIAADGQETVDPTKVGVAAAGGAALGGLTDKILAKITGQTAVKNFAKRAGSEENARMDAEITKDLASIAGQDTRLRDGKARSFLPSEANALETRYADEASNIVKQLDIENKDKILFEINHRKAPTPEAIATLQATPEGQAVLDILNKSARVRTLTSQLESQGGILPYLGRQAVNWAPGVLATIGTGGTPIPLTMNMLKGVRRLVGGGKTRTEMAEEAISLPNQKAAEIVGNILGESKGTKGLQTLDDTLLAGQMASGREAAAADRAAQADMAKKAAEKVAAAQARAEEKRMISEGGQILKDKAAAEKAANGGSSGGRKAAEKDPNQLISELQGSDPTYLLSLSNPFGAPRNPTEMGEFSKTLRLQMEAAAKKKAEEDAAKEAAKASSQGTSRNQILEATRTPLGGAFQELLQGGRSGLNLTTDQAIDALRITANKNKGNPIGEAANTIRKSGGDIPNPDAFYGLQNEVRKLQEKGALGGQPGALSEASTRSSVVNPISYAANVRNAETALKNAQASAPSNALAQFASVVAREKSPEGKRKLLERRLLTATPDEAKYLTDFIEPLTRFGAKTK